MGNPSERFQSLPGRLLMDTCVLNLLQDEGEYIFEGQLPTDVQRKDLRRCYVGFAYKSSDVNCGTTGEQPARR